jgi:hypothetical protein
VNFKKLTIFGAICLLVGGAIFWSLQHPPVAQAKLPHAGLATPRAYVTPLVRTPVEPTQSLAPEPTQFQMALAVDQAASTDSSVQAAVSDVQAVANSRGSQPLQSANQYIYSFMDAYQPMAPGGGCAEIWEIVPDYANLPNWLTTPDRPEQIYSKVSLYFLAAMLIHNDAVDASECENGGISLDNQWVANVCGLSKAYPAVIDWQNRFNKVILEVSQETGVPAQLMKNIFSRESQFWPGIFTAIDEAGLGQLTVSGADTLLMWNTNFYDQFCPQVLIAESCKKGYTHLSSTEQQMLTGALVRMVNATCPNCPNGVDPALAEFSVRIFAEGLVANCAQVSQIIENETQRKPNRTSSYQDLWLFTLVNYHAGAGCLTEAIRETAKDNYDLDWDIVASNLPAYCSSAKGYTEEVIYMPEVAPNPTPPPTQQPTATPEP